MPLLRHLCIDIDGRELEVGVAECCRVVFGETRSS
jgi:hypothetical protein